MEAEKKLEEDLKNFLNKLLESPLKRSRILYYRTEAKKMCFYDCLQERKEYLDSIKVLVKKELEHLK